MTVLMALICALQIAVRVYALVALATHGALIVNEVQSLPEY